MNYQKKRPEEDLFPITPAYSVNLREVAVCFADIRGFTDYTQKTDIHLKGYVDKLLVVFFSALNKAFKDVKKNLSAESNFGRKILDASWPIVRKTMGDGVMIVWEYPQHCEDDIKTGFTLLIIDFIQSFQTHFYKNKETLIGQIPHIQDLIRKLHIGIGLTSGYAWQLSGLGGDNIDYTGTPVNRAARLQQEAQPCGLVADFSLTPHLLLERYSMNMEGEIDYVSLKGLELFSVWKATQKIKIEGRTPRNINSFQEAMNLMKQNRNLNLVKELALSIEDTVSIFQIRKKFEVMFVGDLARRLKRKELSSTDLEKINPEQEGEPFHKGVAILSTSDINDGIQRSAFVKWAYECTLRVHENVNDDKNEVKRQHGEIYNEILEGDDSGAESLMDDHLQMNFNQGMEILLSRLKAKHGSDK